MYRFDAELWLHQGDPPWHFITIPEEVSDDIDARTAGQRQGFGSVRVRVQVGATTWATSVFPDTMRGAYILPAKKQVRNSEGVAAGDQVSVELDLLDV